MPQLDWSTFVSQAFWLIVCFCALWAMLAFLVMPKLANVVELRKRKIVDYVQKADSFNTAAKNSLNKYNETLAAAKAQAEQQLSDGRAELKKQLESTNRQMTEQLNKKIADNEFLLASEKNETLLQIEDISQELAYSILQKLGFLNISREEVAKVALKEKNNG
jgi:F-type H+-transporting ATPase subunit b